MTLVEIMIVVAVIAILSLLAIPAFLRVRNTSLNVRFVIDLRVAASGFQQYSFEHRGQFPPETPPAVVPLGMEEYLRKVEWDAPSPLGGQWDWTPDLAGFGRAVRVVGVTVSDERMVSVDERLDDGDLSTGMFQKVGGAFAYAVE